MHVEKILKNVAVFILFLFLAYVVLLPKSPPKVELEEAKTFVLEDLKNKYPTADKIEIVNVEDKGKYFLITAAVTLDYYTKCPRRIHHYYLYPEQGFSPQPAEFITKNCKVSSFPVAFEEEAIILSWQNNPAVEEFIEKYHAKPKVKNIEGGWEVVWKSNETRGCWKVIVHKNSSTESFFLEE